MNRPNEAPLPDPLAYLLTWTTYGTWLPGDSRGWVDYQRGERPPNPMISEISAERMREPKCVLNSEQRCLVEAAITDHCEVRRWELHAVNCRSNHVHVVVAATQHPRIVRDQLKAWCTRRLKEHQTTIAPSKDKNVRQSWWTARGSHRFLNDQRSLEAAIRYVREAQDFPH